MYAKYVFKAGSTAANVLADVVKLIADGAINTLSGDAVQASCSKAGVATGWTSDDGNYAILSAPFEDGAARKVHQLAMAGTVLTVKGMDSWNAATHAGANVTTAASMTSGLPLSSGGTLNIVACPEIFAIWDASNYWLMAAEVPRVEPFFKNRAGSISAARTGTNAYVAYVTRSKNPIAAGDSVNWAAYLGDARPMAGAARGENEELIYQLFPVPVLTYTSGYQTLLSQPVRGLVSTPRFGVIGDIYSDGAGKDYVMLPARDEISQALGVLRK